jgi:hypothetical protein
MGKIKKSGKQFRSMLQILGENLMNAFNSLESPMDRVACSGQVFMLSAFTDFFGLGSRFFFVRRLDQDDSLFPQCLGFPLFWNTAFEKQASCEPHDRSPLSFLEAIIVQKFPRSLSSCITAFCGLKNLFQSGVKPLRRKYAINLSNAFFRQNFTGSLFKSSSSHGSYLAVSKTLAISVCPLESIKAGFQRIEELQFELSGFKGG